MGVSLQTFVLSPGQWEQSQYAVSFSQHKSSLASLSRPIESTMTQIHLLGEYFIWPFAPFMRKFCLLFLWLLIFIFYGWLRKWIWESGYFVLFTLWSWKSTVGFFEKCLSHSGMFSTTASTENTSRVSSHQDVLINSYLSGFLDFERFEVPIDYDVEKCLAGRESLQLYSPKITILIRVSWNDFCYLFKVQAH